ncbi:MAG TPA: dTMP kinase [Dokdonella sp.]|nr:dTMP kinase [Dokdonella sp.]
MSGRLITLEGGEGAGKSTVLAAVRERLEHHGIGVDVTREPGGTPFGEAVRKLVLDPTQRDVCAESELLLMFAARAQLVRERIEPALAAGHWVLSDRYTDASYAYQGGGRGQPIERIADLERWAAPIVPGLTLLLDLPIEQGLARARARATAPSAPFDRGPALDRIESEPDAFFERVRAAYRARAAADPARFRVIDASRPVDEVRAAAVAEIDRSVAAVRAGA